VELYKCESDGGKKRVLLDSREEKENTYGGEKALEKQQNRLL